MNHKILTLFMLICGIVRLFPQQVPHSILSYVPSPDTAIPKAAFSISDDEQALLWSKNPLSSHWYFSINNIIHVPSEDGWLREEFKDEYSHRITYTMRAYFIEQVLLFDEQRQMGTVLMRFSNNSGRSINLQPSLLLDTNLGEEGNVHFTLSNGERISGETILAGSDIPEWIESAGQDLSLKIFSRVENVVNPIRILMANWLRLQEEGPAISSVSSRSFDKAPLSKNDSAILFTYKEIPIASKENYEINFVFSAETFGKPDEEPVFPTYPETAQDKSTDSLLLKIILLRLDYLRKDIDWLNTLIRNEESIDDMSIAEAREALSMHKRLLEEYEDL